MNLNADAWLEIVFDGRNKAYGAYYLRRTASKRRLLALSLVVGGSVLLLVGLHWFYRTNSSLLGDLEEPFLFTQSSEIQTILYDFPEPPKPPLPTHLEDQAANAGYSIQGKVEEETLLQNTLKQHLQEINEEVLAEADFGYEAEWLQELDRLQQKKRPPVETDPEKPEKIEVLKLQQTIVRYIYQRIVYPETAIKDKMEARVICSFVVQTDGSATDIKLEEGYNQLFDNEVWKVLQAMPTWVPVVANGKPIPVKFVIPIDFRL